MGSGAGGWGTGDPWAKQSSVATRGVGLAVEKTGLYAPAMRFARSARRPFLGALLATVLASCEPVSPLPPPHTPGGVSGPGGPALHDEALRELSAVKSTEYRHKIWVDEAQGIFEYDCSGFVDYAISNVAPAALDALFHADSKRRPAASTYVTLLTAIPEGRSRGRWMHLKEAAELVPGDVVAWLAAARKPDPWGQINTGHVMIVDGSPRERSPGEWVVPVIDSSLGHGGSDGRRYPEVTGLGRGTIVLVFEGGSLVGYRSGESPRATLRRTTVALGRIL
jgi:hypothetical protein